MGRRILTMLAACVTVCASVWTGAPSIAFGSDL